MRKMITRSISATVVECCTVVFEKGVPTVTPMAALTFNGVISEEKALKEVRKVYGNYAQITNITQTDEVYEISVEDFLKYAKKIELPTPAEGAAE